MLFILKRSYGGHDRPDEDVDEGRFPQYEAHPQIQNATVEDQENPRRGTKENKQEVDNGANDPGYWITGNMNSLDDLTGLMSDEDILITQMMKDNGGTLDFMA